MKKIIAMLLALTMMATFAGCNSTTAPETTEGTQPVETTTAPTTEAVPTVESALAVLEGVWALYGEDEKFFAMGGDWDNMVDGAPGKATNTDFFTGNLIVPADQTANITDAASLIHGMNANTFTGAAYAVADANAFATAMQTAIQGNQWICGFPEKLLIASVDGFVVVAFGVGDAMTPFQTHLTEAFPGAQILVDEAITG